MPLSHRWIERPQRILLRRALFQIHLWVGIGIGFYVLAIGISGSAIVFRHEILRNFSRSYVTLSASGSRLSADALRQKIQEAYPRYELLAVYPPTRPDRPDTVILRRGSSRVVRLFDPYTGADLGDPESLAERSMQWLLNLHDNLLAGRNGRNANGFGAVFVTILGFTGLVLWWPGVKHWRRALSIQWNARFPRFNWDLHSATGFWCSVLILVWGISGIVLCFPSLLIAIIGGRTLTLLTALHFGRFNFATEILWTFLGLSPALLFVTGLLMWWFRVLVKKFRRPGNVL